jgi:hypothetical protein
MAPQRAIAYQSRLAPHLEQIRRWRRARKTWREIRDLLATQSQPPVDVTLQAVQSFFKSATNPRRRTPLGFEPDAPVVAPPAASPEPSPAERYRRHLRAPQPPSTPNLQDHIIE